MGVSEAIVEATLRRAAGRKVTGVKVRVSSAHAIDAGALAQWFQMAADGTPAQDAEVDVVVEPVVIRCRSCGNEQVADNPLMAVACPRCGGVDMEVVGTESVVLESVAMEAPG
jgi:hydrogenase nickel incorporation protein HypA/HybF